MRVYDNGSLFSVTVSSTEVDAFRAQWPCSGIPAGKPIWFQFEKRNGDLVDMRPPDLNSDAVLALSHDAGNYGVIKLGLPDYCKR